MGRKKRRRELSQPFFSSSETTIKPRPNLKAAPDGRQMRIRNARAANQIRRTPPVAITGAVNTQLPAAMP